MQSHVIWIYYNSDENVNERQKKLNKCTYGKVLAKAQKFGVCIVNGSTAESHESELKI